MFSYTSMEGGAAVVQIWDFPPEATVLRFPEFKKNGCKTFC